MRIAALLLLVGCIDAREPVEAEPYVGIVSMRCDIAGAQLVVEGTFDVRLQPGQQFRVEHATGLAAGTKTNAYYFFGCNDWKTMQDGGCVRLDDQPETQSVSLRMTDNLATGTLPDLVRVQLSGVVETDDVVVQATRTLTCLR